MSRSFRHPEILEIARRDGKVTVERLASHFGVTLQTIRRDLTELADGGKLDRVHGGAVLPSGTVNIEYEERRRMNLDAKRAIARVCARAIPDAASLFLNIGTTTEAVAEELRAHRDLVVVTNNANVARIVADAPGCDVTVTGGQFRRADGGLVGPLACDAVSQFKFDVAVLGCSALDQEGDILDFDAREVSVGKAVLHRSRNVFLVADSSKFARSAPVRLGSLAQVDIFFTDTLPVKALCDACARWGTQIVISA